MNEVNNAGRVGFYPKGVYSDSVTYNFLDFVYYGGATYVAKKETTGNTPDENNEFWQILAQGGNNSIVIGDETVEFVEATARENISSGEMLKTMLGKIKKWYTDFKTVAFTGSYNDLSNKPTIPSVGNGTLTIQKNGTNVQTFTANQSKNATANITVPTKASDVGAVATSKVLTTKEQINANTDATNVAGATAVKAMVGEINGNLSFKSTFVTLMYGSTQDWYKVAICKRGNICILTGAFVVPSGLAAWESHQIFTFPAEFVPENNINVMEVTNKNIVYRLMTDGNKANLQFMESIGDGHEIWFNVPYISNS